MSRRKRIFCARISYFKEDFLLVITSSLSAAQFVVFKAFCVYTNSEHVFGHLHDTLSGQEFIARQVNPLAVHDVPSKWTEALLSFNQLLIQKVTPTNEVIEMWSTST